MVVKHILTDAEYAQEVAQSLGKVLIVDFFATWCGPCRAIAPVFEQLSLRYPTVRFVKVDSDKCQSAAASEGVSALPTFIFYVNKVKVDSMRGGNPAELETKVRRWAETGSDAGGEACPVPGQLDLTGHLDKTKMECLNEDNAFTLRKMFESGQQLKSDADEQIILNLVFQHPVRIHSLRIKAPADTGPKDVKLFINNPITIDFDTAEAAEPVQAIEFTPKQLETGDVVELRFVRFQNVNNLQIFIVNNQSGGDVTVVNELRLYGTPMAATNMGDFKRVAGKAGEGGH